MQDFLEKLDQELDNMQSSNKNVIIDKKDNSKSELEKKVEEKIKKYNYNKNINSKKTNKFYNNDPKITKFSHREKFSSKFPHTKFYLPSLRDKYTRYIPIG
jgi:ABC-type uncharacterized transport system substrate-binding protein